MMALDVARLNNLTFIREVGHTNWTRIGQSHKNQYFEHLSASSQIGASCTSFYVRIAMMEGWGGEEGYHVHFPVFLLCVQQYCNSHPPQQDLKTD